MSKSVNPMQLKPGDLIIATQDVYFHYNEEVKKKRILSQCVGDIIMVNNPKMNGSVGGTGIHDGRPKPDGVRPSLGLGCSFDDGTYRMAKPDDPGYIATRETWLLQADRTIVKLRRESFFYGVVAAVSLALLLGKCLA